MAEARDRLERAPQHSPPTDAVKVWYSTRQPHVSVLEEIRVGLELNEYGAQQKRLTHLRFLREVYNYEHVDSSVIFETLYLTLSYGHGTSEVSEPRTISEFNPLASSKGLYLWFGI
ncbi:hypothetical protein Bca52824_047923 [Brassica carinata]|uniref:MIF4G domain-containing protein n=1 Tax=Brassica carinata TaxID=52824 RepID=A0A8X7RFP9_BRACI|nr:hypothetical protein Bca52824_047923 [Brassica carinata]